MKINALHTLFLKHPKACTDTRNIQPDAIFFALKGAHFNGNTFALEALKKGAAYAVVDEVIHPADDRIIMVRNVLAALQELASWHRDHCKARIIGLTGSNGKTTTKELMCAVLSQKYRTIATKGNFNNHIGVPLTLLSIRDDTEMAIIEMGANHLGEIAELANLAKPDYGYISNFGKAHLEGFGSLEGVIRAKTELYHYLKSNRRHIFLNADDPVQLEKLQDYPQKTGFSTNKDQFLRILFKGAQPYVSLAVEGTTIDTRLIGSYNFTNCAAAVLIGIYFDVSLHDIKHALESYVAVNNRSQRLRKNGHEIILDAYNANPSSMRAAIENFEGMDASNKVVFLGDMFELGAMAESEHREIAMAAKNMPFEKVFLIGDNFMKAGAAGQRFASVEALSEYLREHPLEKSTILIKGSRGMAMERILEVL